MLLRRHKKNRRVGRGDKLNQTNLDGPVEESRQDRKVKAVHPDHVALVEDLHNLIKFEVFRLVDHGTNLMLPSTSQHVMKTWKVTSDTRQQRANAAKRRPLMGDFARDSRSQLD